MINLTNALLAGMVPALKRELGVPILCTLQGDDIFTEMLPEPHRSRALELLRDLCGRLTLLRLLTATLMVGGIGDSYRAQTDQADKE